MNNRLQIAQEDGNEEVETKILAIIKRKKDRDLWRWLNYSMSKSYDQSTRIVSACWTIGRPDYRS